jgi:hypothetical protein
MDGERVYRLSGPSTTVIAIVAIVVLVTALVFVCSKSLDLADRVIDNATQQQVLPPEHHPSFPTAPPPVQDHDVENDQATESGRE